MPDLIKTITISSDEEKLFEEIVVKVSRTTKVVAGGKRMKFSALVVIGNKSGKVGYGYGKAAEVPFAVVKAIKSAKKNIISIPLSKDHTIPHEVKCKQTSTTVLIKPASEGTGLKAGYAVRAMLTLAGVKDALSKVSGSSNPSNVVKSAFLALRQLKNKEYIEQLRGVRVFTKTPVPYKPKVAAPVQAEQVASSKVKTAISVDNLVVELKSDLVKKTADKDNSFMYTLREGKKYLLGSSDKGISLRADDKREILIKFDKVAEFLDVLVHDKSVPNVSTRPFKTVSIEEADLIASIIVHVQPKKYKAINQGYGVAAI